MRQLIKNILVSLLVRVCDHPLHIYIREEKDKKKTKFCPDCGKILED